ncbi:hypothetical protein DNTS_031287 [Danionella cerebrum]|uniref:DEP domain-containing protein n=1 Tax=Danionella cerebrum TaxID=2873325 RepID=A0A553Q5Y3_9TELE|nr:hypothetical protein DNTS_031287 [Danionella translucida]
MDDVSLNTSTINGNGSGTPSVPSSMSIDKLLPALLECFGIILCGYIAGRTNIISVTQSKGLGNFVSKFALPALLFKNMVLLDFDNVIWPFFFSILVAKVTVFVFVCVLTLLVANRESRFSKAGLFAIFATQSNDFALGFPIVDALYRNTHPEYLQYIYLVAPVSLMILNPLGFGFCEVQRRKSGEPQQQTKLLILGSVVFHVLKNPIVFMVVIGVISHFLLGQKIPPFMEEFLDGLANSFGGAALFYLGLTMVGQLKKLTRSTLVALILLITAKLLLMPLICRGMVEVLDYGNRSSLNHSSLSNYAFLYGVFPTAPSVAIYASHYSMELEVVTSGMVVSTFLSAPIMYVSAWLLTIPWMDAAPLATALQSVGFNVSIISLFALMWSVGIMVLSRRCRRAPHVFTINLFTAQLLSCVGMIAWNFVATQNNFVGQVLAFALLYGSLYSTYVWPGLIVLSLLLLKKNEELNFRPGLTVIAGWGFAFLAVGVLLLSGHRASDTIDSAFFYGKPQVVCTCAVLCVSIALCGVSLALFSRRTQDYENLPQGSAAAREEEETRPYDPPQVNTSSVEAPCSRGSINSDCQMCECACGRPQTELDGTATKQEVPPQTGSSFFHFMFSQMHNTDGECLQSCSSSRCLLVEQEKKETLRQSADMQSTRHILLCLLLTVCSLAGLISFAFFGLDKHLIISPFKKRLESVWQGWVPAASSTAVSEPVTLTCSQFLTFHKERCIQDVVHKKRCGSSSSTQTFLGQDLVLWLQHAGLAADQQEALRYGEQLLEGGVIQHITNTHGFEDEPLHYRFT